MAKAETKTKEKPAPAAKVTRGAVTAPATAGAATGSVVNPKYKGNYSKSDVKTASGKRFATDNGDEIAAKLRGLDHEGLRKLAKAHGLLDRFDEKWAKLNPGMQRMNLGNALRAQAKKAAAPPKPAKEAKQKKAA